MQATLLLADDNSATRSALGLVLEKRLEGKVVGEAAVLPELYQLVSQLQPDLLILAWELPDFMGAPSLKELRRLAPQMKVVALSARPEARAAALEAGVDGFVSMVEHPEALFETVRRCCLAVRCSAKAQAKG